MGKTLALRRPPSAGLDDEASGEEMCGEFGQPLLAHEARYRNMAVHKSCYSGKRSLVHALRQRSMDPKQLKHVQRTKPEKYCELMSKMKPAAGGNKPREVTALNEGRGMVESFTTTGKRKREKGWWLLNKADYVADQITRYRKARPLAKKAWHAALRNPDVKQEIEDGETVVYVKKPTEVRSRKPSRTLLRERSRGALDRCRLFLATCVSGR